MTADYAAVNGVNGTATNGTVVNGAKHTQSNGQAFEPRTEPLAIVGMACRFGGGVTSPERLWELVSHGKDVWSEIPDSRFNSKSFYHPDPAKVSAIHAKSGYFIEEDVGAFDVSFFNEFPRLFQISEFKANMSTMSADVAAAMDPQLRLQLEVVFEALESAGIPLSKIAGSNTSVFTGSLGQDYKDVAGHDSLQVPRLFVIGNDYSMMANRISHFFDLRGHSTAIHTACSTSLMGLHLACQSLRSSDSDAVLVSGAGLRLSPSLFSDISTTGLCGPDGKCYAFDHRAQGYGRGEGVGALIVKRLSDAVRDGDPIRVIIRETGANQNGNTASITSPDTEAQKRLIEQCYAAAGLDPLETALVEAHGTGTMVGDPREANAIGETLGRGRPVGKPLYMASVKTNIGHTEAASGLAAVIKVAMSIEHDMIAPSLNFERINPDIDLDRLHLKIPTSALAWPPFSAVRRASVNNFGFGGTNTHVILEEAGSLGKLYGHNTSVERAEHPDRLLFVLSARDKVAAGQMTVKFREHLQTYAGRYAHADALEDLAYTLGERRSRFPWTVTISATDVSELTTSLDDVSTRPVQNSGTPHRLGFVFNGQGAQWFGMGRELMSAYPVYAQTLRECDRVIASFGADWSVIEELGRDEESSRVNDVQFSMPLSCAVQLALVELLRDLGVQPAAVTGHSSGEVAAAFAAGALSLREAMACTYFRGLINAEHIAAAEDDDAKKGGMMAVGMAPADVAPYLKDIRSGQVVIACVNSPSSVTLSGDMAGIEELRTRFEKENIFARTLRVQAAFHSHHMLPLEDQYLAALEENMDTNTDSDKRAFREHVLFVSPVTGDPVHDASQLGPQHWVQNMTQPVLFAQALHRTVVGKAKQQQVDTIIEIGPHSALAGPIRQSLKSVPSMKSLEVVYGSCLERGKDAVQTVQTLAGFLIGKGFPVNTSRVNFPRGSQGLRVTTGLPSYPWNHNQRFWHESNMSLEHKGREHPPHDLLGIRSPGMSDKMPMWRHIIRTSELPWVRDHHVQGDIVYPASGFIAMVIEATRQVHGPDDRPISGYRFSDVDILKAVIVPENAEGVETQLFIEPVSEKSLEQSKRRFRVYGPARTGQGWDEIVRGFIAVETDESSLLPFSSDVDLTSEYPYVLSPKDVYDSLTKLGVAHGPIFQNLVEIRSGRECSSATLQVGNTSDLMPYGFQQPHVIHPTTLDAVFQGAHATLSTEARNMVGTLVPHSIKGLYISAQTKSDPGSSMLVLSRLLQCNRQGIHIATAVFPTSHQESRTGVTSATPVMQIDGMRYQSLGDTSHAAASTTWDICAFLDYEPSFSLNDPSMLMERLRRSPDADEKSMSQELERATYHLIADAVGQLSEEDVTNLDWHHRSLYKWMLLQLQRAAANELAPKSSRWAKAPSGVKAMLLDRVADSGPEGAMVVRVGRRLIGILRREVAPLEVMLEGDLLHRVYSETRYFRRCTEQLAEVVAAFARERPRARILEIGGGTGGGTEPVLQALGPSGFDHYDFTDISSGFFPRARERFAAWGDKLSFTSLNIEDDVARQGFAKNSYDLVIGVQVLHATKNMESTMGNVRKLLKDGGRLLLIETTQDWAALQLIFGVLPSWWLSEEPERAMSPNMPLPSWQRVLQNTGFSGIDIDLWDSKDEEQHQGQSLIVSTAVQQHGPKYDDQVALVYDTVHEDVSRNPPKAWLQSLARSVAVITGSAPTVGKLGEVDCNNRVCIVISNRSDGVSVNPISFDAIKPLLLRSKGVLWVTSGATIECPAPDHAVALGMLRTYRAEDTVHRFVSLDLDPSRQGWDEVSQGVIARVFSTTFDISSSDPPGDVEFAERGGTILLPRVRRDDVENATFANEDGEVETQPFIQPGGRQLRIEVTAPGRFDSIVFRDDEEAGKPLADDWVEVEPRAYGLNDRDVVGAMARLDEVQRMGSECAGVVTRAGLNVDTVKEGDRVVALAMHGCIASRVRVPWTSVIPIPNDMLFSEAAGAVLPFAIAYYSMFEAARLEQGETVLIHEATEDTGQACISLAQWKGLQVLATVGTPEQRSFLEKRYGIPGDRIFSSRDASFVPGVLAATKQRGVDAVINSLTGPLLQKSCGVLAMYGRFVELGARDVNDNMSLGMEMFRKGASFTAVDLVQLANHRGHVIQRILIETVALLGSKTVHLVGPIVTHPMSKIGVALRSIQAEKDIGKHVIVPEPGDVVKTLQRRTPATIHEDATYLIIGGLGGLGRSLAKWLVDRGAKNLILCSRNVESSPYAQPLVDQLGGAGINLVFKNCDIADLSDLQRVLKECSHNLPPVRGIIHGGAVFNDVILERMTTAQWETGLAPKVAGTWNLHRSFSTAGSLDFFAILSSCNGMMGNASQAHYTAGGAFQDAVARNRAAHGLPCVTIDLGLVTDLGYLADAGKQELSERLETSGQYRVIQETDLHRLIDYAVRVPLRPVRTSQVVTGIAGSAIQKQRFPWTREQRFAALAADDDRYQKVTNKQEEEGVSVTANLAQSLANAQDADEAAELVEKAVIGKLSDMFARPVEDIDATQPLSKYGVDSLVAVELRNWLVLTTRSDMSIFDLLGAKSLRDLASTVGKRNKTANGV